MSTSAIAVGHVAATKSTNETRYFHHLADAWSWLDEEGVVPIDDDSDPNPMLSGKDLQTERNRRLVS